jgi:hypothetical protein
MSGLETIPPAVVAQETAAPPVDYGHILDTFGLGPAEAMRQVTYNGHEGTVATMLTDPGCPVGGKIAAAYEKDGFAGVKRKVAALNEMMDDGNGAEPAIVIGPTTRSFYEGKATRDEVLAEPEAGDTRVPELDAGRPDFLVPTPEWVSL